MLAKNLKLSARDTISWSLFAFFSWAVVSFISNSALSAEHVAIAIGSLLGIKTLWKNPKSASFGALFALFIFCVLSVLMNWTELSNPLWNLKKCKYPLMAALLFLLSLNFKKNIKPYLFHILMLFLLSFTAANIYGIIKYIVMSARMDDTYDLRLSGFFGMILSYSYTAVIPLLLLIHLSLKSDLQKKGKLSTQGTFLSVLYQKKYLILMTVVGVIALYLSYSRGPLAGFLLAVPLLFLQSGKKILWSLLACIILALGAATIYTLKGGNTSNRIFQSAYNNSNAQRVSQAQMALKAFEEKPIYGQGYRSLEERDLKIKQKYNIDHQDFNAHAHNSYLEILASTGILGFIAYILWLAFWFVDVWKSRRNAWFLFLTALIVSYLITSVAQSTIIDSEFCFTFFTFFGLTPVFLES